MGSQPSFDANGFARPITQKTYDFLTSDKNDAPLLNRATASAYPTGSMFKPVTALASLEKRLISPTRKVVDAGHWEYGGRSTRTPSEAEFGPIDMSRRAQGLLGHLLLQARRAGQRQAGPDHPDVGEAARVRAQDRDRPAGRDRRPGARPPKWRNAGTTSTCECAEKEHVEQRTMAAVYKCGGIERGWSGGDNVNLAVGQGDLQATPLQLAVMYAALGQQRHDRRAAPGQGGPGRQRRHAAGVPHQGPHEDQVRPARPPGRPGRPAARRAGGAAARPTTSSRAGR